MQHKIKAEILAKLENVQCLRAVAALLVVADHALTFTVGHGIAAEPITSFAWFLGEQGVGVFFVVSGFIMAYTTGDNFGSARSALRFWRRRLIRVVPLYWIFTMIAVALCIVGIWHRPFAITFDRVAKSLLFVPYADGPGAMRPILGPGWTLNYEMMFYAIFGLGLLLPRHVGIGFILASLGALVGVGAAVFPVIGGAEPQSAPAFLTNPLILLFGGGAILGWARASDIRLPVPAALLPAVVSIAAATLVFGLLFCRYPIPLATHGLFWTFTLVAVAVCVFGPEERHPWLQSLGDASYSLYLTHFLVLLVAAKAWGAMNYPAAALFPPLAIALTVPVALGTYRWIERPVTTALSRQRTGFKDASAKNIVTNKATA